MTAELLCVSRESAQAVADEANNPDDETHTVSRNDRTAVIAYFDKRFPYDVASWALENGHAEDAEAAATIASL